MNKQQNRKESPRLLWLSTLLIAVGSSNQVNISKDKIYELGPEFIELAHNFYESSTMVLQNAGLRLKRERRQPSSDASIPKNSSLEMLSDEEEEADMSPTTSGNGGSGNNHNNWTNVRGRQWTRKKLNQEEKKKKSFAFLKENYRFYLEFDRVYPSYVYFTLASAVERAIG